MGYSRRRYFVDRMLDEAMMRADVKLAEKVHHVHFDCRCGTKGLAVMFSAGEPMLAHHTAPGSFVECQDRELPKVECCDCRQKVAVYFDGESIFTRKHDLPGGKGPCLFGATEVDENADKLKSRLACGYFDPITPDFEVAP